MGRSESVKSKRKDHLFDISDVIGQWGNYQRQVSFFTTSTAIFSAFNNLAGSFYGPKANYKCVVNNVTQDYSCPAPGSGIVCDKYIYDKTDFDRTIVTEWDLVCDREFLASFTQSIFMFGISVSALLFGYLSDKYGRTKILQIALCWEILGGFFSIFANSIVLFTIARFFQSLGTYGRNLTAFLLGIESVGSLHRAKCGVAYQLGWAVGYVMLPLIAYLSRDYVMMFYITTIPEILWVIWMFSMDESPKWLISKGYYDEAEVVLRKALKINGMSDENLKPMIEELRSSYIEEEEIKVKKMSFFSLWKSPMIRKFTIILYFTWFANAYVYYGISLNIGVIGGNLFVNFALAGLIEVPSYLLTIYLFNYMGRKTITAYYMLAAGFCCLVISFFSYVVTVQALVLIFALLGKFFITSTFAIIYVYSAELYPTPLRQVSVGSCSIFARGGSILAPFVKELSQYTNIAVTMIVFATFSLIDGCLVFLLPETKGKALPDSIEEVQQVFRKEDKNSNHTSTTTINQ